MAESQTAPLTDEERAELEELRAQKAQREEEERARRERAELEALRAEREAVASAQPESPIETPAAAPVPKSKPAARAPRDEKPVVDPENLTFAQRMVLGDSAQTDEEEIPGMPPAQKIIVILAIACVIGFAVWMVLNK